MNYLPTGEIVYNDMGEVFYNLFLEIGLAIDPASQYLYDQETRNYIKFEDKFIKASVNNTPVYAGKNDVVFDPQQNYPLMIHLFGFYLDNEINTEYSDIQMVAYYIQDDKETDTQRIVIKTSTGEICSNSYHNLYLGYIDIILRLSGTNVNLSNFDVIDENDKPKKKRGKK